MKQKQPTARRSTIWRTLFAGVLAAALFADICVSNIMYTQDVFKDRMRRVDTIV